MINIDLNYTMELTKFSHISIKLAETFLIFKCGYTLTIANREIYVNYPNGYTYTISSKNLMKLDDIYQLLLEPTNRISQLISNPLIIGEYSIKLEDIYVLTSDDSNLLTIITKNTKALIEITEQDKLSLFQNLHGLS